MITQLGVAFLLIWMGNFFWIVYQIVRHTSGWVDKEVDVDEIFSNFLANTTQEQMENIQTVARLNPMMGLTGVILLLMGWII